jgi:hypothetical protein
MFTIYVVYHRQREDLNVFFTDINKAQQKIKELQKEVDLDEVDSFNIKVLTEGKYFEGCF